MNLYDAYGRIIKRPSAHWIDSCGGSSRKRDARQAIDDAYNAELKAITGRTSDPLQRRSEIAQLRERYERDILNLHDNGSMGQ